jgi:uncharacterized protein (UPF0276 family)
MVGIGFRPQYRGDLFLNPEQVDFLEITADHYFTKNQHKKEELILLKNHFTLIPHGLNTSLGSAEGLDLRYVERIAEIVNFINPPYWSEHLCFTKAGGIELGHLAAVPFTNESIETFCKNIETIKQFIKIPLILENITYPFVLPASTMKETEFITKIVKYADVGLLLDVTNLFINAQNHHFDYKQFLKEIPTEKVVQFHFVGAYFQNGIWIDSHAHEVNPEIWEVVEYAIQNTAVQGLILERDENLPSFQILYQEIQKARNIFKKYR